MFFKYPADGAAIQADGTGEIRDALTLSFHAGDDPDLLGGGI